MEPIMTFFLDGTAGNVTLAVLLLFVIWYAWSRRYNQ